MKEKNLELDLKCNPLVYSGGSRNWIKALLSFVPLSHLYVSQDANIDVPQPVGQSGWNTGPAHRLSWTQFLSQTS